ncbi:amino acid adenylation domain-containing protein [Candidatus Uabimicrobium sp. HlEnr_7]|uniref:amino acid adenylation domain-containing protein n=1 Tax=Candidatus Uabimicrobium helgolandensis TaxID=3095367 RepID=UPI00355705A4
MNNIYDIIKNNANCNPNSECILDKEGKKILYKELLQHIESSVATLRSWGINRNDRVAIVLSNGPEMAVSFLTISCGATSAPLNPGYREKEYHFYLSDLQAKAIIVKRGVPSPARMVAKDLEIPIFELESDLEKPGLFRLYREQSAEKIAEVKEVDFCEPQDVALVLHTSGTTSRPKIVPLSQDNICTSARNICETLQLQAQDRCLNVMPLFHIHGLMGVLLSSITSGASVCCTTGFDMNQFFSWLKTNRPTWYSAVPTMHQAVLMAADDDEHMAKSSSLRFIRSSSSSLPPIVLEKLEKTFSVPVIEAYGMTEASHQMTSNPLPPAKRKAGSVGVAAGLEVAIMNIEGNLLPLETEGEIVIRGQNVTYGYENNPQANESAFTNGWFRTGDIGFFDEDKYLYIKGRVKEIINRGGEKISPREVDEVLLKMPEIQQAVTFAVPHSRLGEDVVAAVILREGQSLSQQQIRDFTFENIADFKVPSQILFVDKIPLGPTGKMQRIGLAKKLEHLLKSTHVVATTKNEKSIQQIWIDVLGIQDIGIDDNFFILGGDSLLGVQVINSVNATFNIDLTPSVLFRVPTVQEFSIFVENYNGKNKKQIVPILDKQLPLSFSQERMWYFNHLDPNSPIYNRPSNVRLIGLLDVNALEQSLHEVVKYHEVLRSSFDVKKNIAFQQTQSDFSLPMPIVDLEKFSQETQQQKVLEIAIAEGQKVFDLQQGLKVRVKLLRFSKENHLLLTTFHHVAFDAGSEVIFYQCLDELYTAFSTKKQSQLPLLEAQYRDFAYWQKQQNFSQQLVYWEQKLKGHPPLLEISPFQRPKVPSYRGKKCFFEFTEDTYSELQQLSSECGVTIFMTMFAVYSVLISKYSRQKDIVVGVPFSERTSSEVEGLIGNFINTLPFRVDLFEDQSFVGFLKQVKETTVEALANNAPLQEIIRVANVHRSTSYTPLFQTLFIFENFSEMPEKINNIDLQTSNVDIGKCATDLTFEIIATKNGLQGHVEYAVDLFPEKMIERFASHYLYLIRQIIRDPMQKLMSLNLVSCKESQLNSEQQNALPCTELTIHELFEEQVRKTPDFSALIFRSEHQTYREVNSRANQLARLLQTKNVNSEEIIAVLVERSFEVMIAFLAIAKVGGAYLPIEVTYPQQRVEYLLKDSDARILLTTSEYKDIFNIETIIDLRDDSLFSKYLPSNLGIEVSDKNLAYVIYTSGSTGKPKGVQIEHRQLVNYVTAIVKRFNLRAEMTYGMIQSISFDSVFTHVAALITGGAINLIPEEYALNAEKFSHYVQQQPLDLLKITPQYFAALYEHSKQVMPRKVLILGGESSDWEWSQNLVNKGCKVFNHYGPTETTVGVTTYSITPCDTEYTTVPIGKSLDNTQTYIMDESLQPVPIGVIGELYISGSNVARGYLDRAALTAEKFVPCPYKKNAVMYKTGDYARQLEDGNIQFLGRIDSQIKMRGFRVELGEIEAALRKHKNVKDVVATVTEVLEKKEVVAYIVFNKQQSISQLKSWLAEYLPVYMIPSHFVSLTALPLKSSGKIDRKALPVPRESQSKENYIAPQSEIEIKLVMIWEDVLQVQPIGIDDNFFELGGHSLLAITIVSRIKQELSFDLPLRFLFEIPTVRQIAERSQKTQKFATAIAKCEREEYPLSSAQKRLWFLYMLEPDSAFYNMSFSKELCGDVNKEYLQKAWNSLVERQGALRTYLCVDRGGDVVQKISSSGISIDFVDACSYERAEEIIELTAKKPFVLTEFPLVRCQLISIGNKHCIFNITIHHIISDFWSMGILWEELSEFYNSYKENRAAELPELQVEYGDFCVWQQQQNIEKQKQYWLQQFDNYPTLDIVTDKLRAVQQSFCGANYTFDIDENRTKQLQKLAEENDCSLFITILSVFNILLSRYSGEQDIIVGCPIANRHYGQIENNIGFFLNTLALRTQIDNEKTFCELLGEVKETCLQAYTHQDYPFEQLVEDLNPTRDMSRNPLFQIMLNMIENVSGEHTFDDIEVIDYKRKSDATKFDITLYVRQQKKLQFTFRYNTDLFFPETIERMADHFVALLQEIIRSPQQKITQLKMRESTPITHLNKGLALVPVNENYIEFTQEEIEQSIYSRYVKQVEKFPENLAVNTDNKGLSYKELANAANDLAYVLKKELGDAPDRVALLCSHNTNMIIAILGVLRAGKIYIPLETHYFSERQKDIVADADIRAIITEDFHVDKARELYSTTVINIDELGQQVNIDELSNKDIVSADTTSYILYTSGSTGIPKGVVQNHRNVLHFIRNYVNNLKITSDDRLMMIAGYNFDASIMDIFGALLSGASLYLFDLKNKGIENLGSWMVKNKITVYHSTPTVYRHFVGTLRDEEFADLRLVVLGGEAVYKKDVELYQRHFGRECLFVNGFGPTESTVTLQNIIDHNVQIMGNSVSVGYPVEDTEITLLNEQGKPTEIYGEIAIKSEHLALEYWRQPQITKEAFTDLQNKKERLYRTGDMGYLQADGRILFTGRKDFQVKIRGIRVELGEIEAAIEQYPLVFENAVVYKNKQEESFLVGYLVVNNSCDMNDLNDFLHQKLPGYMVPAHFVILEKLPLNSNGKVDKKKLTALDVEIVTKEYVPPQTEMEKTLCRIWQEVLKVEKIGITDDFFALGGHSLLVITVMSKIREFLRLDEDDYKTLPLYLMLTNPTVAKLAQAIDNINGGMDINKDIVICMNNKTSNKPIFLVHSAHVDPISYHHLCKSLDGKVTAYTIRTEELDPYSSIEKTASYHIKNIRSVQPDGPYVIGGMCMGGLVAFEVARQLQDEGENVKFVFIMDSINIPGMKNYKSRAKHKQKKRQRKIKNLRKVVEFVKHLLCGDFEFISQKIKKIKSNINRQTKKISDPRMRLRKKMRDRLRIIRDDYHPQNYNGTIIYIRSEKAEGEFSEERLRGLAKEVICYKVEGTIHKDVARPIFAEKTSEIVEEHLLD